MLKVGVTGGLGAGKTTVTELFAHYGVPVIDTDEISRELTTQDGAAIPRIREAFGASVFKADGSLDRDALRSRILDDDSVRQQLEAILHPLIRDEAERRLARLDARYVLVVVPLLVETGAYDRYLDRVLVVDCSEETQVQRALSRGGWSEAEIRGMMDKQVNRQARLDRADDVINTECNLGVLRGRVAVLHEKYLALALQAL